MQNQIKEFNKKLVQDKKDITIIEYVKELNDRYFNIDISFIDDFLDLVDKDGFIIHHDHLEKYDVLKINHNTGHVKRLFEQHDFEDGKCYFCQLSQSGHSLDYLLKPEILRFYS